MKYRFFWIVHLFLSNTINISHNHLYSVQSVCINSKFHFVATVLSFVCTSFKEYILYIKSLSIVLYIIWGISPSYQVFIGSFMCVFVCFLVFDECFTMVFIFSIFTRPDSFVRVIYDRSHSFSSSFRFWIRKLKDLLTPINRLFTVILYRS